VTFIIKPGKTNSKAMAYRPISLSPFMLKTKEILVDTHITHEILGLYPYIDTNLPANQESPLKLHCTM